MVLLKYAVNHPYQFEKPMWAAVNGFAKAFSGILVEACSILTICVANDILQIAMNFIALAVVADFDDIVF
jgi:hypothetical protein